MAVTTPLGTLLAASLLTKNDVNIPMANPTDKINNVYTLVFAIAGGIAVIIIMFAGIKFVTSQGDPQAIAKARNTIIYAAIGLAVSVAALSIITFVVERL